MRKSSSLGLPVTRRRVVANVLTAGAAGVWNVGVEGDPGITPIYDLTTWKVGMNYPGSTQVGLGKRLLEQYPWQRFEPHPEWAEAGSFGERP